MSFITKKALPRRTFLRGMGAAVALPLLDSMIPAATAAMATPAKPVRRLGYISLIAVVFVIAFRPEGIAVLAGLAVFHLLAALATSVPALKEFRKA